MKNSFTIAIAAVLACVGAAQDSQPASDARLRQLEEQNRQILERLQHTEERLQQSEARNGELQREVGKLNDSQVESARADAIEGEVNRLTTRTADAVNWKDLSKLGFPLKFYGFIRLDSDFSTARVDNIDATFVVQPETGKITTGAKNNDSTFAFSAKLTRIGIDLSPRQLGDGTIGGKIEMDFHSFIPNSTATTGVVVESRASPRIRLAYIEGLYGDIGFRFGQDWDIIAPLTPSVNTETVMWNAGNLGDRRPQAEFWWGHGDPNDFAWNLKVSAGLTGAVNGQDLDAASSAPATGERDGFDSGHPHLQARAGATFGSWVKEKQGAVGIWGLLGSVQTDKNFGGHNSFSEWTLGGDVNLPLFGPLALRGEGWVGEGLGDERGNIGQYLNTTTGKVIGGWGGWAEFTVQITNPWSVAVGGSIDDPRDSDLVVGSLALGRARNWSLYFNTKYDWTTGLKTGFDAIYWETEYLGLGVGNTVRMDLWVQLDF